MSGLEINLKNTIPRPQKIGLETFITGTHFQKHDISLNLMHKSKNKTSCDIAFTKDLYEVWCLASGTLLGELGN